MKELPRPRFGEMLLNVIAGIIVWLSIVAVGFGILSLIAGPIIGK